MDKFNFETKDGIKNNVEKIAEIFPSAVTEGRVNFDTLRTLLGDEVAGDERYEFTWVGKKEAMREAGRPIRKALRPCPEESKNWEETENLYIEGDNLEVLKLLQESYLGKIKMIYIDPPYNTGNDFIYADDYSVRATEYQKESGVFSEDGDRLFKNTNTNGRYHSDWCSMMYPRLALARNLLTEDGVIFISIDDNEQDNLKMICNEIFGESNFLAQVVWERAFSPVNLKKHFSESHDYLLFYAKNKNSAVNRGIPRTEDTDSRYQNPDNDPRGPWQSDNFSVGPAVEDNVYEIVTPSGKRIFPPSGRSWVFSKERTAELIKDNRVWFGASGNNVPRFKRFLTDVKQGITPMTIWKYSEIGHSQDAKQKLKSLFDGVSVFDYPKSVELIKRGLYLYSSPEDIILDFFSGSSTTAQAVMEMNAEGGGKRKFIMVQLPEKTDEKSEIYKAGYKDITEIGKERIRRSGDMIKTKAHEGNKQITLGEDPNPTPDIGFRVFKVDDSNMKDVFYSAEQYKQIELDQLVSNIKEDRTDMDLLFACLLDWGLPLSMPHYQEEIDGVTVHTYNNGDLIACFADNISEQLVRTIASRQPLRVVFRDSSFVDSPSKINVEEIFKLLAPYTSIRVL